MQFQEYPKKMRHPEHVAAEWTQLPGKGEGLFKPDTVCTKPERFPEVTVNDKNQEQYYASRGYRPNNMGDAAEYEAAMLEVRPIPGFVYAEFPKWKYHAFEAALIVHSREEEKALGAGWADQPIIATEDDVRPEDRLDYKVEQREPAQQDAANYPAPGAPKPKKAPKHPDKRRKGYRDAAKQQAKAAA
jgi:hypothetical protein